MVVVVPPVDQDLTGMAKAVEHRLIQAYVAQPSIETLDAAVLLRLA